MAARLKTRPDHVLEDPGALAIASLYARSFLEAAQQGGIDGADDELNSFVDDLLVAKPDLQSLLSTDSVSRDEKLGLVDRAIAPHCSEFFANFLRVLIRHGRAGLIQEIRQVLTRIREEQSGHRRVIIRTARPLSEQSRGKLYEQLKSKLGFDPIFWETVDESLIGGLVIQVGDTVYDSSLRTRLRQLSGRLVERAFNEIQSGRDRFSHPEGD